MNDRLTALVVAHRHEETLDACLASVGFADRGILVDIGGFPAARRLADAHDARLVRRPAVPVVEQVRAEVVSEVRTPWVLLVDPDEVMTGALARELEATLEGIGADVGSVRVPWRFHFRGKPLRTTAWGRSDHSKRVLVHRDRVRLSPDVHRGIELRPGFREISVGDPDTSVLNHYWCDSYEEFFEKHRRYLRHEGASRYRKGQRFTWSGMIGNTALQLGKDLIYHRGLLGGLRGISLSLLRGWYEGRAWWELRRHEREQANP